jgi:NADPH:quinone reductase
VRSVAFSTFGGPEVLGLVELPRPEPRSGQIRVRVIAATVNPTDVLLRSGGHPQALTGPTPWVAGRELAGFVDAVGDATAMKTATRVAAVTTAAPHGRGAHAEFAVVDSDSTVPVPDHIDLLDAATVPMNGLTALQAVERLALSPGDSVAVTGAAGAVGAYAVQIAAARRLRVIGVASDHDEHLIRAIGAEDFVSRHEPIADALRAVVPGGVDGLIDAALIAPAVIGSVRDGGRVAALRALPQSLERGITVVRVTVNEDLHARDKLAWLMSMVARNGLTTRVAAVYTAEQGQEAYRAATAPGRRGRVVIAF